MGNETNPPERVPSVLPAPPKEQQPILRIEDRSGKALFGSILATVPGFGLGHLVQGRYDENGWLYTFGEAAGLGGAMVMLGIKCDSNNKNCSAAKAIGALVTLGTYVGLHIWEIVDAWNWDPINSRAAYTPTHTDSTHVHAPPNGDFSMAMKFKF